MKRIFLILLLLSSTITNVYARNLFINGETIAINLSYKGVLITDTYIVNTDGTPYHMGNYFKENDLIIAINGKVVNCIEDVSDYLKDDTQPTFTIIRDNKEINITINNQMNYSKIPLGLHLKDSVSGIGTITYYDPNTHMYGSLGHSLVKNDQFIKQNKGNIYDVDIYKISRSSQGMVGEKIADTSNLQYLGNVIVANGYGVYGRYNNIPLNAMEVAVGVKNSVHEGEAYILTQIDNNDAKLYKIIIEKVELKTPNNIKGLQFKIVDSELIEKCGGIVQGMSGSPILQDGKIIGAVTHVVVKEPTRGYGIFIENMLEAAE
ncbi:MAG: hypothetical protein IKM20_05415 [Erysipelotrichales bacterium]|nr:hypothetical protein [Erysipelotrichales bacterium]